MKISRVRKKSYPPQLSSYSVFAFAFLTGTGRVASQVAYHDIDPDSIADTQGALVPIDMNEDGTADIILKKILLQTFSSHLYSLSSSVFPGTIYYNDIYAFPAQNVALAGEIGPFSASYPDALAFNDTVSHQKIWLSGNTQSLVYSLLYDLETQPDIFMQSHVIADGQWFGGATDHFLGVRIIEADGTHYGWIRLDVSADNRSFTVKDYAYDANPYEAVLAGTMETLPDSFVAVVAVPDPIVNIFSSGEIIFVRQNGSGVMNIQVFDSMGQVVSQQKTDGDFAEICLPGIPAGIYIVRVSMGNRVLKKKVLLSR